MHHYGILPRLRLIELLQPYSSTVLALVEDLVAYLRVSTSSQYGQGFVSWRSMLALNNSPNMGILRAIHSNTDACKMHNDGIQTE